MIAGGIGTMRPQHALMEPKYVKPDDICIVIGGTAILIGGGGGGASSMASGDASVELDFASVQRANAEIQRRAQEVINGCCAIGSGTRLFSYMMLVQEASSNALPELVHDAGYGAEFDFRTIDNAGKSMSQKQIFCCEAQERYVMMISQLGMEKFNPIAERERCGYSVVDKISASRGREPQGNNKLILMNGESRKLMDFPMSILFGKPPRKIMNVKSRKPMLPAFDSSLSTYLPAYNSEQLLREAISLVLALGTVGSKEYLITIGDRSICGHVAHDQMVGPWQVPVADCGMTTTSLTLGCKTGDNGYR